MTRHIRLSTHSEMTNLQKRMRAWATEGLWPDTNLNDDLRECADELDRLSLAIEEHNASVNQYCIDNRQSGCNPYKDKTRLCSDCPKRWLVQIL